MRRIISRSWSRRLLATMMAIAGLMLVYEVTTFDLLPWGGPAGATDPSAPVQGAQLDFTATAYCKGTTTASGTEVRTGIAAADAAILPVGSVVNVTSETTKYNGVYTIMDTGPRVQGRALDLYMWSCHEALAFGRKPIQITVLRLGWNPRASMPSLIDRFFHRREAPAAAQPEAAVEPEEPAVSSENAADDQAAAPTSLIEESVIAEPVPTTQTAP